MQKTNLELIEKILEKQYGAVKPPWIDKELFYKLPFNFCDRWCEKCKLSSICRVYQKDLAEKKEFAKQGIDPYSWDAAFKSMHNNFVETMKLIKKDIKRWKIKITEEDSRRADEEYDLVERLTQQDSMYTAVFKITASAAKFTEDIRMFFLEDENKKIGETLEVLTYYELFLGPKLCRAIRSSIEAAREDDEEKYSKEDAKTSAFLVWGAFLKLITSLDILIKSGKLNADLLDKAKSQKKILINFKEVFIDRFDLFNLDDKPES